jgi:UDP-N-acetyl-2-amino-2-deoxyglucuronate dehydrogenase
MGPVAEVTAMSATGSHRMEAEDTALALLRFTSGALGTIIASTAVYPGFAQQLEITGADGTVIIEDGDIARIDLRGSGYGRGGDRREPAAASAAADPAFSSVASHAAQIADLLTAIEQGRHPQVTADSARDVLEIVNAAYESARAGRPVTLNP